LSPPSSLHLVPITHTSTMWAYLFWSLVAAWLFSLRPKRVLDNRNRADVYGELPAGQCGHKCCHAHGDGHATQHVLNADPEISTPRKEQHWADNERSYESSERGSVSPFTPEVDGS
jgi:hypothetical protein